MGVGGGEGVNLGRIGMSERRSSARARVLMTDAGKDGGYNVLPFTYAFRRLFRLGLGAARERVRVQFWGSGEG